MTKITVTPAEDDEVIVAGAVEPEPATEPATEPEPAPAPGSAAPAASDDLDLAPMPFAQRVVVVAAVVCIIGALVYYFVAMR